MYSYLQAPSHSLEGEVEECVCEGVCVVCFIAETFTEQKDPLSAKFQRKLSDVSILL